MTANEIRQTFLNFFKEKGHKIIPSAPIVLKHDPTLMFTNAGMNRFKDVFLGSGDPPASRVADTQKCLRVSGKHNDLDEVGKDTYHHTMFEMLGNWSFGDYFKEEAIAWAWELLTGRLGIQKDRLYVTIFKGDAGDGLDKDREALEMWKKWVPGSHILEFDKKDNFWEMGETGPCGPSSEIHYDNRPDEERKQQDGSELVNRDLPSVIEIWNLVFIQYNRKSNGSLTRLPQQHVDTGMGFERLSMILQNKNSNYDTDLFTPLIRMIEDRSGKTYGKDEKTDMAIRVVADHIRAIFFTIADGQLPSNTGAGYVIRRILRRAVRYGYSYLGFSKPFLYRLGHQVAGQFGDVFPNVQDQAGFVEKVILEEEQSFLKTLETGLHRLNQYWKEEIREIPGETVFELYDTYGFPADLTRLIAEEHGIRIDEAGFEREMRKQKTRSKQATKIEAGDWHILKEGTPEFVGYDSMEVETDILRYREVKQKNKIVYQLVLEKTPFYAESGGQVGDTGILEMDGESVKVVDTKKENELIVHFVDRLSGQVPSKTNARIDLQKRNETANNHTATHLLHAALKQVLGEHVQQKGSFVGPDYLRFDFSHFEKVKSEELEEIERMVNEKVLKNIPRDEQRRVPVEKALEMGATALFGEKYGDFVRMITFDPEFSRELCGGTHVASTGQIGLFKIITESSVAAGVRRIEAVTAKKALDYVNHKAGQLDEIAAMVKNPADPVKGVRSLLNENDELRHELDKLSSFKIQAVKKQLQEKAEEINGITFIGEVTDLSSSDAMKQLAYEMKNEISGLFLVLGTEKGKKALLSIMISDELVNSRGFDAGMMIRRAAEKIQGGGGGQPFFATAGGGNPAGLKAAIEEIRQMVTENNES